LQIIDYFPYALCILQKLRTKGRTIYLFVEIDNCRVSKVHREVIEGVSGASRKHFGIADSKNFSGGGFGDQKD